MDCAGAFNNFGCHGGLPSQAFEYIKYSGGLDTEEEYPYAGKAGVCKFSSENVAVKVVDSVNITKVGYLFTLEQQCLGSAFNCLHQCLSFLVFDTLKEDYCSFPTGKTFHSSSVSLLMIFS